MSENGEIYTAGKNFTLPLALTALTNSTSDEKNLKELFTIRIFPWRPLWIPASWPWRESCSGTVRMHLRAIVEECLLCITISTNYLKIMISGGAC